MRRARLCAVLAALCSASAAAVGRVPAQRHQDIGGLRQRPPTAGAAFVEVLRVVRRQRQQHQRIARDTPSCEELCKEHSVDKSLQQNCIADCRVKTDLTHESEKARTVRRFAKKHGRALREAYEDVSGEEFAECHPTEKPNRIEVKFEDVDKNGDGHISSAEAVAFARSLCVPKATEQDIFQRSDVDRDGLLNKKEWVRAGEETVVEYEIERFADNTEDQVLDFDSMNVNKDDHLEDSELLNAFMKQVMSRYPDMTKEEKDIVMDSFSDDVAGIMLSADDNGDGLLSRAEYKALFDGAASKSSEDADKSEDSDEGEGKEPEDDEKNTNDTAGNKTIEETDDSKSAGQANDNEKNETSDETQDSSEEKDSDEQNDDAGNKGEPLDNEEKGNGKGKQDGDTDDKDDKVETDAVDEKDSEDGKDGKDDEGGRDGEDDENAKDAKDKDGKSPSNSEKVDEKRDEQAETEETNDKEDEKKEDDDDRKQSNDKHDQSTEDKAEEPADKSSDESQKDETQSEETTAQQDENRDANEDAKEEAPTKDEVEEKPKKGAALLSARTQAGVENLRRMWKDRAMKALGDVDRKSLVGASAFLQARRMHR
eukprot:TRINITY_DN37952_c0_g1_i1.p1 TRINITY_DN37952_c0_g1~~TRINITY_DN37952_c0_g1_i1.p1  ORF type:complete len:612 (+),score=176.28 TRINITY_DN37952_c0_g1_i1:47-1837(+)